VIAVAVAVAPDAGTPRAAPAAAGIGGTASDISALTPDERADRLFTRVMAAADRLASERARGLQEYVDHATDVDEAVVEGVVEGERPASARP